MMGNVGMSELLLIFLVTLLVFGAKRIPEIARGLGQGLREFRSATQELKRELTIDVAPPAPRSRMPAAPAGPPSREPASNSTSDFGEPVPQQPATLEETPTS